MPKLDRLLLQCRAGFEKEVAAEITQATAEIGYHGYCQLVEQSGYLLFITPGQNTVELITQLPFHSLVFVRQWLVTSECLELNPEDRISGLIDIIKEFPVCSDVRVESPDTTEGREMASFCRKFSSALAQKLKNMRLLEAGGATEWRLSLFALSGTDIYLGLAPKRNSSRWEMGIPRLKFPKQAPSRSTLKLEEAWHWFIPKNQWEERLAFGQKAVDLGAAPGGWTWQLVNRSMFVTSVDNGPMQAELMESGQVEHVREDAYEFIPDKPVDWMVCDVIEKPVRTAKMVVEWISARHCRESIFNLKLPMRQRFQELQQCLEIIDAGLSERGVKYSIRCKHLYHDREEVTCHIFRLN